MRVEYRLLHGDCDVLHRQVCGDRVPDIFSRVQSDHVSGMRYPPLPFAWNSCIVSSAYSRLGMPSLTCADIGPAVTLLSDFASQYLSL